MIVQASGANPLSEAIRQHQSGNLESAERLYRAALAANARDSDASHNLGVLLVQRGDAPGALPYFRAAVEAAVSQTPHWLSLVECLVMLGRLGDALSAVAEAERAGMGAKEAETLRQRVAAGATNGPSQAEIDRVVAQFSAREYQEAESNARRMVAWWPGHGFGWKALGAICLVERRFSEALPLVRRAVTLLPEDPEVHNKLGGVLHALGRLHEADQSYRRAIALKDGFSDAHSNHGVLLRDLGRMRDAENAYRRAIELNPGNHQVFGNLGALCKDEGRLSEAEAHLRHALELVPDYHEATANLAGTLAELGRFQEAEATYRQALRGDESSPQVHSNYLFFLAYHGVRTGSAYLAEARQWEVREVPERVREAAARKRFANPARTGRRLRVGYVSGDFKAHPVTRFIEPVFERHDRARVEVHAYATNGWRDENTERINGKVDRWNVIAGLSDDEVAKLIGEHGIDVLVDLSGHTGANRLGVFAHRAAPVQCHYLGYFASTGLSEMDYWIGDATLILPEHEAQYSETVWRLPRVWVAYEAPQDAPEPHWRPAGDGTVRLGSFNNLGKITERTIELWAKVLRRMDQARLVLKTRELEDAANRKRIETSFERHGIPAGRLELRGRTENWTAHMALYDTIDIALDPVGGIGGGTTTCEALWMGVPVVTLAGARHADRMTVAMLEALGHREWAAENDDAYVAVTAALAADKQGREALRHQLRETVATSALCDARSLARALEDAYASMFDRRFEANRDTETR